MISNFKFSLGGGHTPHTLSYKFALLQNEIASYSYVLSCFIISPLSKHASPSKVVPDIRLPLWHACNSFTFVHIAGSPMAHSIHKSCNYMCHILPIISKLCLLRRDICYYILTKVIAPLSVKQSPTYCDASKFATT